MKACALWLLILLGTVPCFAADPHAADKAEVLRLLAEKRYVDLDAYVTEAAKHQPPFYGEGDSRLSKIYRHLSELDDKSPNRVWEEHIGKVEEWSAQFSSSVVPQIVLGSTWVNYAWKARGGDWASAVGKSSWKLFGERLAKARQILESAEKLPGKDPELYNALLWVAIGQGWSRPEMEAAFNKGIRINPNYFFLYETKARYLLPRWHGKPGDWERFATQAADARGGEDGDLLYLVIACSQAWTEDEQLFRNTDISYQRMQRGWEASLRRSWRKETATNCYARYACFANDRPTAKRLFQSLGPAWDPDAWEDRQTFVRWKNWALGNGVRTVSKPAALPEGGSGDLLSKLLSVGYLGWALGGLIVGLLLFAIHKGCTSRTS